MSRFAENVPSMVNNAGMNSGASMAETLIILFMDFT